MIKKSICALGIVFCAFAFTSCRDKKPDKVVKEVNVEKPEKEQKGILERAGEKVDKKVNDKVDKEIDKIDDN